MKLVLTSVTTKLVLTAVTKKLVVTAVTMKLVVGAEKLKISKIYYGHEVPVVIHKNKDISLFATLGLHLGISAKLKIWQVPACKMEPRSGTITTD